MYKRLLIAFLTLISLSINILCVQASSCQLTMPDQMQSAHLYVNQHDCDQQAHSGINPICYLISHSNQQSLLASIKSQQNTVFIPSTSISFSNYFQNHTAQNAPLKTDLSSPPNNLTGIVIKKE